MMSFFYRSTQGTKQVYSCGEIAQSEKQVITSWQILLGNDLAEEAQDRLTWRRHAETFAQPRGTIWLPNDDDDDMG